MGGGGGGKKNKDDGSATDPTTLPAYGAAPSAMTFQPMMPGFQDMLASQLAAGFGGGGGMGTTDFNAMLSGLYQPMTVMRFTEPISTTASLYDKKQQAPISTGNAALDRLLMGQTIGKEEKSKDERQR